MGQAVLDQEHFRFGDDDNSEALHGWLAAQGIDITAGPSQTVTDGQYIFLRFGVANTGSKVASGVVPTIRMSENGGAYASVGATGAFKYATHATYLTDGDDTTSRLTGGTGTFDSTNAGVIEGAAAGASNDITNGQRIEVLIVLQYDQSAAARSGSTYAFRVYDGTTALDNYTATPTITVQNLPATGELFTLDFEEGNLNDFDSTGGTPTATGGAALVGSYGMEVYADGIGTDEDGTKSLSTHKTDEMRFRFYFDPNTIGMTTGDWMQLCRINTSAAQLMIIYLEYNGSNYVVWYQYIDDSGTNTSGEETVNDGSNYVEFHIQRESADGQADGTVDWWVNGTSKTGHTSVDDYNAFNDMLDIDMGNINVSGTYTGYVYLDDLVMRDDGTLIGAASSGQTINAGVGQQTFTGVSASIVPGEATVTAATGQQAFTGVQATISAPPPAQTVTAGTGQVTYTGVSATIVAGAVTVTAATGQQTFTGISATIVPGAVTVTANVGQVTHTGTTASVGNIVTINAGTGQVTFTGVSATIVPGAVTVSANTGQQTYTGVSATVAGGTIISAGVGQVTFTGVSATIKTDQTISAAVGQQTYTGVSANISAGAGSQTINAGVGQVTYTGVSASIVPGAVTITAGVGQVTHTGASGSVTPGAVSVTASPGQQTFTGIAATVSETSGQVVTAGVGQVTYTGVTATILNILIANVVLSDAAVYDVSMTDSAVYDASVSDVEVYSVSVTDKQEMN